MSESSDLVVARNREAWDREVEGGNEWTVPLGPELIAAARAGDWSVVLIGHESVPRDWFPASLAGLDVLCLASGGGQQGPVLSAAGARVDVFAADPGAEMTALAAAPPRGPIVIHRRFWAAASEQPRIRATSF